MRGKNIWEAFFDAHAPVYEDNIFTKNTIHEVDFLLEELSLQPGGSILDVGCGTGRHSITIRPNVPYIKISWDANSSIRWDRWYR